MNKYPHISLKKTGRNIQKLMIENNLTVLDIQEACGFEYPQAIYKWFWGSCLPNVDNLVILSTLFKIPIEKILIIEE